MTADLAGGWLVIPYDGADQNVVEIGVDDVWYPAFLDYDEAGVRIAKIRPPSTLAPGSSIALRVSGVATPQGYVRRL